MRIITGIMGILSINTPRFLHDYVKDIDDPNIAGWVFKPDISAVFEDAVFLGAIRLSDNKPTVIYPASLDHSWLGPKFKSLDIRRMDEKEKYAVGDLANPLLPCMDKQRINYILGKLTNSKKTHFIHYEDKKLRVRFSHDFFKHYSLESNVQNTYFKLQK
jgi:hypothetical protein